MSNATATQPTHTDGPSPAARPDTGAGDFDFFVGTWSSRQRRLKRRLQGCAEWETFAATITMHKLPGGTANFDTFVAEEWRPGWVGMTTRIFNPATALWSIYWFTNEGGGVDARSGHLEPPVVGRFEGDVGLFEGDDVLDGRPIRVQYRWERRGPNAARWQQAFSPDAGRTWEVNWVADFERAGSAAAALASGSPTAPRGKACGVVELRCYRLQPGGRETLIDLFDGAFIEPQEACGMAVLGQFRDLDRADRFVWLRGFADMAARPAALTAFYDGPVWRAHRDAANATMVDSDDVLLLQPAWPGSTAGMNGGGRAPGAVRDALPGLVALFIQPLQGPAVPALLERCRNGIAPRLERAGGRCLGWYVTEPAPNNDPRLPVREGAPVLVGCLLFSTAAAQQAFAASEVWSREIEPRLAPWSAGPAEWLRLVPTARSALHA